MLYVIVSQSNALVSRYFVKLSHYNVIVNHVLFSQDGNNALSYRMLQETFFLYLTFMRFKVVDEYNKREQEIKQLEKELEEKSNNLNAYRQKIYEVRSLSG